MLVSSGLWEVVPRLLLSESQVSANNWAVLCQFPFPTLLVFFVSLLSFFCVEISFYFGSFGYTLLVLL